MTKSEALKQFNEEYGKLKDSEREIFTKISLKLFKIGIFKSPSINSISAIIKGLLIAAFLLLGSLMPLAKKLIVSLCEIAVIIASFSLY